MNDLLTYIKKISSNVSIFFKWFFIAVISGTLVGLVGTAFYTCLERSTEYRTAHSFVIFFLPVAGLAIVGIYHLAKDDGQGTNQILRSVQSGETVSFKMAPLIFITTVITHFFGGSAGREGAAVQIGGSIGNYFGGLLKMEEFDRKIMTMCCVSAAFSAVFGTPIAAAIFAIEVVSVGIMYYAALVPCAVASLTAHYVAVAYGCKSESFHVFYSENFDIATGLKTVLIAMLASVVSIIFCIALNKSEQMFKKLKNPYIRIFTGGIIIVLLTLLVRSNDYNGAGIAVIKKAFDGEVNPEAFLLKIIFTAITLGCGFKGGEIVPSFYIGATFGAFFGSILQISPLLGAAVGMISVFCAVTNCPIASLIISLELFGMTGVNYYLLAIAVSYMLSGYYGLYNSQKIIYSKYKNEYVNKTAHH